MKHNMELLDKKSKYKQVVKLLSEGHNYSSASRIVGFSVKHISHLARSKYFAQKIQLAQEELKGKVQSALITNALGTKITKEVIDSNGEVTTTIQEVVPDTKAQLAFLQAKDKEGGWVNGNQVNVQVNQALSGISNDDLLLTLRSAQAHDTSRHGGEGGVLSDGVCETNTTPNQPTISSTTSNHLSNHLSNPLLTIEALESKPFERGYDSDYDVYLEAKGRKIDPNDNFHDHNKGRLDEPVEGPLDNVGEDFETSTCEAGEDAEV